MSTTSDELVTQTIGQNTAKYFTLAAMALLIYDYCLTFDSEVKLIWGRRWDATRVIFTISRYVTFIGAVMTTYAALGNRTGQNCHPFNSASNAIHIISIISAEGLLILRTYAFWQQNKVLLYSLICFACFCLGGAVGFTSLASSRSHTPNTDPSGCIFQSSRTSAIQYAFLVVFELVLLGLNVFKRYQFYRSSRSYLVATLYYDGLLYMMCIISVAMLNIFVDGFVEISYANLMDLPQLVLHGVLASRILFSLRNNHQAKIDDFGGDILLSNVSAPQAQSNPSKSRGLNSVIDISPKNWDSSLLA